MKHYHEQKPMAYRLLLILLLLGVPFMGIRAEGLSASKTAAVDQTSKVITGNVVDENGEPLIGVSVQVKGESGLAVTDIDGN